MAIKLGTAGNDTLTGTSGWDTLYGLAGNDSLVGGTGNDILSGGDGNDTLEGGAGADALNGGAGADVFKYTDFNHVSGDKITDFSSDDKLDFSAITNAKFIGNAQFNGVAGEIRYYNYSYGSNVVGAATSGYSYISIDTNGDAQGDVSLYFSGSTFNFSETAIGSKILQLATNQTLNGTDAADSLTGGAGNDTISAGLGNDSLVGGEGNDVLQGGDGNDTLVGGLGADTLTGGAGNDTFRFASADDFLNNGYYGGDSITDLSAGDKIDLSAIAGLSYIGSDAFSGVPGQYRLDFTSNYNGSYQQYFQLAFDFDGDKNPDAIIKLSDLNAAHIGLEEVVKGSNQLTVAANKNLVGTAANETLTGGNGYDTLNGGAGNDSLAGGTGDDSLTGGDGNDTLVGGLGADTLSGGLGNDTFKYASLAEMGNHAYLGNGMYNSDSITDFAIGDKIDLSAIPGLTFVGVGNSFSGVANQVRIYGDSYNPTQLQVDANGDSSPDYSLQLPSNLIIEETTAGSRIFQVVENKVLTGTAANDTLTGGNGLDTLDGGAGNDSLLGGMSNDSLNGGDGNDTLLGGLGVDTLTGGAGNDVFKYSSLAEMGDNYNRDTITDFAVGDRINLGVIPGLTFVGVGNDFSGVANQVRVVNYYNDTRLEVDTNGDSYADYSLSLPANLRIEEVTAGSKIFQVATDKVLNGTSTADTLTGGNGNDSLSGGGGNDVLTGGFGADTLTGGAGNDVFKYNSLSESDGKYLGNNMSNIDTITDLTAGDKINLSAIDANTQLTGDQAFSFIGNNYFTGTAGELRYQYGTLLGDVNGDYNPDFAIQLSGTYVPTANNFIL